MAKVRKDILPGHQEHGQPQVRQVQFKDEELVFAMQLDCDMRLQSQVDDDDAKGLVSSGLRGHQVEDALEKEAGSASCRVFDAELLSLNLEPREGDGSEVDAEGAITIFIGGAEVNVNSGVNATIPMPADQNINYLQRRSYQEDYAEKIADAWADRLDGQVLEDAHGKVWMLEVQRSLNTGDVEIAILGSNQTHKRIAALAANQANRAVMESLQASSQGPMKSILAAALAVKPKKAAGGAIKATSQDDRKKQVITEVGIASVTEMMHRGYRDLYVVKGVLDIWAKDNGGRKVSKTDITQAARDAGEKFDVRSRRAAGQPVASQKGDASKLAEMANNVSPAAIARADQAAKEMQKNEKVSKRTSGERKQLLDEAIKKMEAKADFVDPRASEEKRESIKQVIPEIMHEADDWVSITTHTLPRQMGSHAWVLNDVFAHQLGRGCMRYRMEGGEEPSGIEGEHILRRALGDRIGDARVHVISPTSPTDPIDIKLVSRDEQTGDKQLLMGIQVKWYQDANVPITLTSTTKGTSLEKAGAKLCEYLDDNDAIVFLNNDTQVAMIDGNPVDSGNVSRIRMNVLHPEVHRELVHKLQTEGLDGNGDVMVEKRVPWVGGGGEERCKIDIHYEQSTGQFKIKATDLKSSCLAMHTVDTPSTTRLQAEMADRHAEYPAAMALA